MATLRTDEIQLRVLIDGSPARRELAMLAQEEVKLNEQLKNVRKNSAEAKAALESLGAVRQRQAELRKEIGLSALSLKELQGEMAKARAAFRAATPGTEQWVQARARMDEVKAAMDRLQNTAQVQAQVWAQVRGQYRLAEMSMHQLQQEAQHLQAQLLHLNPNNAQFARLQRDLLGVEARMTSLRTGMGPFGRMWEGIKMNVASAGAVLAGVFAGGALINGLRGWVRGSAELSDSLADVRKTTGLTQQQVEDLSRTLGRLNTRTPRAELLELAREAGKLGYSAKEDVLAFVRAGDQLRVALGEDLGDDAIKNIAKLVDLFKLKDQFGLEESMLKVGSAINELGMASTASEGFMVDFLKRLGGIAPIAGISIDQTLALGATLDSLGQTSEVSSTALSKLFVKLGADSEMYAKLAGMSVKDFERVLKENALEGLIAVLEGTKRTEGGVVALAETLGDMGIDAARAAGVFGVLSNNTERLRQQMDIARKSFDEGNSVLNEFNVKNSTLAANLEIIGKRLHAAFVSSGVVRAINSMARGVREWIEVPVTEELAKQRTAANLLAFEIMNLAEGDATRAAKIRELKQEYPEFTEFLREESATNQQIADSLDRINEAYVRKILLARKQDELQDIQDRQADAVEQEGRAMDRMNNFRLKAMDKMTSDQRIRFAEQFELIMNQFKLMDLSDAGVMEKRMRFNQWMQKNGMGATLFDDLLHVHRARKEHEKALAERLRVDEEFARKMTDVNRWAQMAGGTKAPASRVAGDDATHEGAAGVADPKALNDLERLRADLAKLREGILLDAMSTDERELAQVDAKYQQLRAAMVANELATQEDLRALDELWAQERSNLIEGQGEKRLAADRAAHEKRMQQVWKNEEEYWLAELDAQDREVTLQMQHFDEMAALYEAAGLDTADLVERLETAILEIKRKYREKDLKDGEQAIQATIQQRIRMAQGVGEALAGLNNMLAASYAASGMANYENTVAAKTLGLAQIAIASGVGVAEAISAGAGLTWPANLGAIASGVGAVLSGIANAISLLNTANIQQPNFSGAGSQTTLQNVPLGAKGMVLPDGNSHSEGGLPIWDPLRQRVVAEVEGGETVLSRSFTRANPDLVAQLLAASARGGRVSWLNAPRPQVDFARAANAMRVVHMAHGGVVPQAGAAAGGSGVASAADSNAAVLAELRALTQVVANWPLKVRAETVLQQDLRTRDQYDRLKASHTVRRSA